jgi:hypothetical protein
VSNRSIEALTLKEATESPSEVGTDGDLQLLPSAVPALYRQDRHVAKDVVGASLYFLARRVLYGLCPSTVRAAETST